MHAFREIVRIVSGLALLAGGCGAVGGTAFAQGPSFSCVKTTAGSIEELICGDRELSQLDLRWTPEFGQPTEVS